MKILQAIAIIGLTLCVKSEMLSYAQIETKQPDPEMVLYAKNDYLQKVDLYSELGKYYRDSAWIDKELLSDLDGIPEFKVFLIGSFGSDWMLELDYDKTLRKYIARFKVYYNNMDSIIKVYSSEISKKNAILVYRLFKAGIQQSRIDNWEESGMKDGFGYYFIINLDGIKTGYQWSVFFKLRIRTLQSVCDNIIEQIRNKEKLIKIDKWTRKHILNTIKDIETDKLRIYEWD